jgi:hypothetical protein
LQAAPVYPNALSIECTPVIRVEEPGLCPRDARPWGRIDIRSKDGNTPLLFYVGNGRWDAALPMLDCGADIEVQNENGVTLAIALDNRKRSTSDCKNRCLVVIS